LQQYETAQHEFEIIVRARPDSAEAHLNLAHALAFSNRTQDAIAQYEAALRLNPNLPDARENLARLRTGAASGAKTATPKP